MRKKNNKLKIIWDYEPSEESELRFLQVFEFLLSDFGEKSSDSKSKLIGGEEGEDETAANIKVKRVNKKQNEGGE